MAISFGFYNSISGDRKYDARQMAQIFDGIISNGVFQYVGQFFATTPGTGMQVIVGTGRAWFHGTWTYSDAPLPLTIEASDVTLNRYDTIVLEINETESVRANSIKIIKGTNAVSPAKPALINNTFVHQYALAHVHVKAKATSFVAADIEIVVGQTPCPFVTGLIEAVDIDALFQRWESEFTIWFDDLQSQMAGDVATNLQNQINQIKNDYGPKIEKLYSEKYKIGDIMSSIGNPPDNTWALCNGEPVDRTMYPTLFSLLNLNPAYSWVEEPTFMTTDSAQSCIDNRGWYYVINGWDNTTKILNLRRSKDGLNFDTFTFTLNGINMNNRPNLIITNTHLIFVHTVSSGASGRIGLTYCSYTGGNFGTFSNITTTIPFWDSYPSYLQPQYNSFDDKIYVCGYNAEISQYGGSSLLYSINNNFQVTQLASISGSAVQRAVKIVVYRNYVCVIAALPGYQSGGFWLSRTSGLTGAIQTGTSSSWWRPIIDPVTHTMYVTNSYYDPLRLHCLTTDTTLWYGTLPQANNIFNLNNSMFINGIMYAVGKETQYDNFARLYKIDSITTTSPYVSKTIISELLDGSFGNAVDGKTCFPLVGDQFVAGANRRILRKQLPLRNVPATMDSNTYIKVKE